MNDDLVELATAGLIRKRFVEPETSQDGNNSVAVTPLRVKLRVWEADAAELVTYSTRKGYMLPTTIFMFGYEGFVVEESVIMGTSSSQILMLAPAVFVTATVKEVTVQRTWPAYRADHKLSFFKPEEVGTVSVTTVPVSERDNTEIAAVGTENKLSS